MKAERFEDLEIWQIARKTCMKVRDFTSREPFVRDFRFRDQMRDSSGSSMDNIAEGFERDGAGECHQFLSISKGSTGEVRSQSYRAFDYGYINTSELQEMLDLTDLLARKTAALMAYIRRCGFKGTKFKR